MKMKISCMRGVCWRRARKTSGRESPARNQKFKLKKFAHESLLSVENNSGVPPRRVTEVGDNWVNIRA